MEKTIYTVKEICYKGTDFIEAYLVSNETRKWSQKVPAEFILYDANIKPKDFENTEIKIQRGWTSGENYNLPVIKIKTAKNLIKWALMLKTAKEARKIKA